MGTLSKNAQVLKAICEERRDLGTTKLQKLVYLVDLEARKLLGRPISEFRYIWWHHGPFDSDIYNAIDELDSAGLVEKYERYSGPYFQRGVENRAVECDYDLTPVEREVIGYVMKRYGRCSREQLLKVAYSSEPMQAAEDKGQPLPMSVVDHKAGEDFGFDLEELIRREKEIEKGNYIPASDFFDALQAQLEP